MTSERLVNKERRIKELEEELEQLRAALPAHSVKPAMLMRIEDLEDELEQLRKDEN